MNYNSKSEEILEAIICSSQFPIKSMLLDRNSLIICLPAIIDYGATSLHLKISSGTNFRVADSGAQCCSFRLNIHQPSTQT